MNDFNFIVLYRVVSTTIKFCLILQEIAAKVKTMEQILRSHEMFFMELEMGGTVRVLYKFINVAKTLPKRCQNIAKHCKCTRRRCRDNWQVLKRYFSNIAIIAELLRIFAEIRLPKTCQTLAKPCQNVAEVLDDYDRGGGVWQVMQREVEEIDIMQPLANLKTAFAKRIGKVFEIGLIKRSQQLAAKGGLFEDYLFLENIFFCSMGELLIKRL